MDDDRPDVAIVGAGIAGSTLATVLARSGRSVLVLERSTDYVDRVRGEALPLWGVAEAMRLGLYDTLVDAGVSVHHRMIGYDELASPEEAESRAIPVDSILPGVPGSVGIGHPVACRALEAAAVAAGATVIHDVSEVKVTAGRSPQLMYTVGGQVGLAAPRLVVGADGRESSVRRQLGVTLQRTEPRLFLVGLLVERVPDWSGHDGVIGTEGETMFYIFPQGHGRIRLYLGARIATRQWLTGQDRTQRFLDRFAVACIPDSQRFARATPAGPCAGFPMNDTWTDAPVVDGVVLIGDAAGHSDPTIGQGLAVALRDARLVGEVLTSGDDWSPAALRGYTEERAERMRRLRFSAAIFTDARMPNPTREVRRRRMELVAGGDAELSAALGAIGVGPDAVPAGCFEDSVRARLLSGV